MHISKTTLDPYTKLFSAHCKPRTTQKGFPRVMRLVPYKNRQCSGDSRCSCSNQDFVCHVHYICIYMLVFFYIEYPHTSKPITLQNKTEIC